MYSESEGPQAYYEQIHIPDGPYPAIVKANIYWCWSTYTQ